MKHKHLICTPVVGKTLPVFLHNLKKVQEISEFVELRIDDIQTVSSVDIDTIRQATRVPCIATCRPKSQGGSFLGSEKLRITILHAICANTFTYVDIEADTYDNQKFHLNPVSKLILSAHYYDAMPPEQTLRKEIMYMEQSAPDIIKIASIVEHEWQNAILYRLLLNKTQEQLPRIMIGMGEEGKMTRILGPLLGAPWTYASTRYGSSAPGQYQIEEIQKIYSIITNS